MNRIYIPLACLFLIAFITQCTGEFEPDLTGFADIGKPAQLELESQLLSMHSPETYRKHLYNLTTDPSFAGTQENRYVRILAGASPMVAQMVKDLKLQYYTERVNNTPILHGL
jgi:hypothetical protein